MNKYIARGPVTVLGRDYRSGDTFEADPADVVGEAEHVGGVPAASGQGVLTGAAERMATIAAAITQLDPDNAEQWLKDGRPKSDALAVYTGFPVSAAERDAAWEPVNAGKQ